MMVTMELKGAFAKHVPAFRMPLNGSYSPVRPEKMLHPLVPFPINVPAGKNAQAGNLPNPGSPI